jgi:zinc D-Ala-D-Ala carboxypeptidase
MSRYFSDAEVSCRCGCGDCAMDPAFMELLDRIRERVDRPLALNSAKRCAAHNRKVSTVKNGPHPLGVAADIRATTSRERFELIEAALAVGITRIGIARSFVHLDVATEDTGHPQDLVWFYSDR